MSTQNLKRIGTFLFIIAFVALVSLICLLFAGYNKKQKSDLNYSNSQQLYSTSLKYKHLSRSYADSAVNYPGSSSRVHNWIVMAIRTDSMKKVFADSSYKELMK